LLNLIKFNKNDVVIDCGSNYGDLYIELSKYIKEKNFIAFEPGKSEFTSLKFNIKKGQIFNLALSNKIQTTNFYLNSELADSSLIKPSKYTAIEKIQSITLDKFLKETKINKVKLLKVDAEGFEPEILLGCKRSLKFIEFIAVDGSRERGIKKEETLSKITNYLTNNKFKLLRLNGEAFRCLFINRKYKNS
jgi:FkbM family methyltransferase